MRLIVLFFLMSGMLTACGSRDSIDKNKDESATKLKIISSIKPIHAIVLAIAGEHAQSEQLIPDYASPHNYSFKPSDIRKVEKADVVFRIDEYMEKQLNTVFDNLVNGAQLISLTEAKELNLLESDDSHNHDNHEVHENLDFHIWTSPKNAKVIANLVTKTLIELDEKNAKNYQQNFVAFIQSIEDKSVKISSALVKHQSTKYIVFHNSWQYFANEFGLQKPIVVDLHEGLSSGAKTISNIRDRIVNENINCVFYDSSISAERLSVITKKAKTVEIDVLAKSIALDQTTYIKWLSRMGNQIESCLSK